MEIFEHCLPAPVDQAGPQDNEDLQSQCHLPQPTLKIAQAQS